MEFPLNVRRMYADEDYFDGGVEARINAQANIKEQNSYFQVDEVLGFELTGQGEHLYVQISKDGQNTGWVKEQFANQLGLHPRDIGHSGLKDRHAVTSQWLSIYAPKREPEIQSVEIEGVEILQAKRHRQKLKAGMHESNRFRIRLTGFKGDREKTESILNQVSKNGFPNYFGTQRFGKEGGNLPKAWQLLKQRRLNRHKKKSIYLSSLRSFLFNRVLDGYLVDTQCADKNYLSTDLGGLTGPLWGRGRLNISKEQAGFEQTILQPWSELCDALEYSGLQQERRRLIVLPGNMSWSWLGSQVSATHRTGSEKQLEISFNLPSGSYATSLLREVAQIEDAAQFKN